MTANVDWRKAYDKITAKLQSSELTINFRPEDWFAPDKIATTLKYDTYSQMYERSVGDQGENFLKDTKVNSGAERARIDDAITFPAE
jgi:hypothetical protein